MLPKRKMANQREPDQGDWQLNKSLSDCSKFLFEHRDIRSDVTFLAKNSAQQWVRIPAHKHKLWERSPVFFQMFCGTMPEASSEIKLQDLDVNTFTEILRYFYCDEVKLTADIVMYVLHGAKKYMVPALVDKCTEYLGRQLNADSASLILEQSIFFEVGDMKAKCLEVIERDSQKVFESTSLCEISHHTLSIILQSKQLSCEEADIFRGCLKWAKAECRRQNLQEEASNLHQVIGDLLYLIHFPTMKQEDFAREVVNTGILTDKEENSIYRHMSGAKCSSPMLFPIQNRIQKEQIFLFCHSHMQSKEYSLVLPYKKDVKCEWGCATMMCEAPTLTLTCQPCGTTKNYPTLQEYYPYVLCDECKNLMNNKSTNLHNPRNKVGQKCKSCGTLQYFWQ